MYRLLMGCSVLVFAGGSALAGGVERSSQSVGILFEQGTYGELNYGYFAPSVSGTVGVPSGDMAPGYGSFSLGYKQSLRDNLDIALIIDQPIGADVHYPGTFGVDPYPLAGTTASLDSLAVTGLVRYRFENMVSLYGGLRVQTVEADVSIPLVNGYTLAVDRDTRLGYVLGVAWERPEIAARVALTYNSAISHTLNAVEFGALPTQFETEVPQSLNLEFQTGIAADTLLFGSVRWVDWTAFEINPDAYFGIIGRPLVSYEDDRVTYNLGVGRRFNETWSGAVSLSHEASDGNITGNLGPTDGFTSIALAGTYTSGNMKITGGIRYVDIGGATTSIGARFSDNSGIGAGIRIGYSF